MMVKSVRSAARRFFDCLVVVLDGTRASPPRRVAENLSRRDGIRAGAVSGPWRSAPRIEPQTPARPAPETTTAGPPADMAPPPSWTGGDARVVESAPQEPKPADDVLTADSRISNVEPRGTRGMVAWILFGVLIAVGLIAAAVVFRPYITAVQDRTVPAAEDAAVAEIAAESVAEETVVAAPAAIEESPIRFRVDPGIPAEQADRIVAALETAGYPDVRIETLPFSIAQSRVGFYHPEDEASAQALAELVAPLAATDRDVVVRDYGDLLPDAALGRLDLWIGD